MGCGSSREESAEPADATRAAEKPSERPEDEHGDVPPSVIKVKAAPTVKMTRAAELALKKRQDEEK